MMRPTLNRRGFLAGTAALAALPVAVRSQGAPARGGALRISVDQAASVLNLLLTRVNPEYLAAELLYSSLTRFSSDMTAQPDLAQSWSSSPDLTEWTFRLRPNLVFHDGSPCTAKDVAASFAAMLDPKTASPARENIGPVRQVVPTNENTAVFKLSTPYADLPVALAYTHAKIIPAAIAAGPLDRLSHTAIGTGPFKLVSFEPDREIVVARNDADYDRARPYLDRVQVVVYPDHIAEASALVAGDTDLMANADPSDFQRLSTTPGVTPLHVRRVPPGLRVVGRRSAAALLKGVSLLACTALSADRLHASDRVAVGFRHRW